LTVLGLTLDEAIRRLRGQGVEPAVVVSRAPRRAEGLGALRVVQVKEGGRELTACAFMDKVKETSE